MFDIYANCHLRNQSAWNVKPQFAWGLRGWGGGGGGVGEGKGWRNRKKT